MKKNQKKNKMKIKIILVSIVFALVAIGCTDAQQVALNDASKKVDESFLIDAVPPGATNLQILDRRYIEFDYKNCRILLRYTSHGTSGKANSMCVIGPALGDSLTINNN